MCDGEETASGSGGDAAGSSGEDAPAVAAGEGAAAGSGEQTAADSGGMDIDSGEATATAGDGLAVAPVVHEADNEKKVFM